MATANFQRWVANQIWGRDKQGAKCAGQGRYVCNLIIFGPRSRPKFEVATWLRLGLVGLGHYMNFTS